MIVSEDTLKLLLGLSSSITDEEQSFLTLIHPQAEVIVKDYIGYDPEQKDHTEYLPRHSHSGGAGYADVGGEWLTTATTAYWSSSMGASSLQLTHLPLRSITTVHVDRDARQGDRATAFADSTLWTVADDYWGDWDQEDVGMSGQLKSYGRWPSSPGTVKVVYRAGYSPTELAGTAATSSVDGDTITTAGVSGAGIAMAVQSTVVAAFTRAMGMRKKTAAGWTPGPLLSERLQDYTYTVDKSALNSGGMLVAMPDDAKQLAEPYRHYGLARL
jgi:hypothetical protein